MNPVRTATESPVMVGEIVVPGPAADRLPGVGLAGFVGRSRDVELVPYPAVTLFLDLGDGLRVAGAGGGSRTGSLVAGLAPGRLRATAQDVECLQVRLSPPVARVVLGTADLGASVAGFDEVWGRGAGELLDRLGTAAGWPDRFALLTAALRRRLDRNRPVHPEVAAAWRGMLRRRGQVRVDELAEQVGWSRKRLWSRFRAQTGVTPKRAARLVRFDRAARQLAAGRDVARVAAECGYADQSHLHRDAVAFAGLTPTAVAAAPWLSIDGIAWAGEEYAEPREHSSKP
ncbi:helix-turn-helix domain-containing protein [Microlunatus sp. GCM10028923]|uniref:helix-turn-helix domain-containing protein n=1 Tax=Microlunatus sp. GCM10028923 TaxID=3273400 RepID=UPI003616E5AB